MSECVLIVLYVIVVDMGLINFVAYTFSSVEPKYVLLQV